MTSARARASACASDFGRVAPAVAPTDLLPQILERAKDYCRRLASASLYFVCRERIEERQYSPPLGIFSTLATSGPRHVIAVSLEYDYQLVRKGESLEEKRILLMENKEVRNEPGAPLKTKLYKHKYLVFGPVALLGEFWQPKHAYTLLGEEEVDKEQAFLIEAAPAGTAEPNLVYGNVWVRKTDFAILRIEWDQRGLGNYDVILGMAKAVGHGAVPHVAMACSYGIEKDGVRFPSRLTIREDYDSERGIFRASETSVTYGDYKFFMVETEVGYPKK